MKPRQRKLQPRSDLRVFRGVQALERRFNPVAALDGKAPSPPEVLKSTGDGSAHHPIISLRKRPLKRSTIVVQLQLHIRKPCRSRAYSQAFVGFLRLIAKVLAVRARQPVALPCGDKLVKGVGASRFKQVVAFLLSR